MDGNWIESTRYVVALLLWISVPAGVLYWLLIHPLAKLWRRIGPLGTFLIVTPLLMATGYGFWLIREPALADRYPLRWAFVIVGLGLYVFAVVIERRCRKHLKLGILVGMPELDGSADAGILLTEGIYAHVRNPRYLDLILGLGGWSLIVNYPTIYWLFLASVAGIRVIVLLEERELRARFGEPYEDYCREVPRLVPRSWSFLVD